jgi:DNA-binding response OmpR family regulator
MALWLHRAVVRWRMMSERVLENHTDVAVTSRSPRLLLADDDEGLRLFLGLVLRHDGYRVREFSNGGTLLEHFGSMMLRNRDSERPALLITDIRMPGASGLDIVAGLRRADWTLPVILMTAFDDATTRAAAEALGDRLVLFHKPFDVDDLRTAVLFMLRSN